MSTLSLEPTASGRAFPRPERWLCGLLALTLLWT